MSHFVKCFAASVKALKRSFFCLAGSVSISSATLAEPAVEKSFSVRIDARMDETGSKLPVSRDQVAQSISVARKRLVALGFANPRISEKGAHGFLIRLNGVRPGQAPDIAGALQKLGKFELKEVCPRNEERAADGKTLAQRVRDGSEIVPGYRVHMLKVKDGDDKESKQPILLNRRTAITNSDVASAVPLPHEDGALAITLGDQGENKMIALTKNMRPGLDRIAILLDGEVISAPILNQVPLGKNFVITGLDEPGEVQNFASAFTTPLEFPLIVEEENSVPTQEEAR